MLTIVLSQNSNNLKINFDVIIEVFSDEINTLGISKLHCSAFSLLLKSQIRSDEDSMNFWSVFQNFYFHDMMSFSSFFKFVLNGSLKHSKRNY